MRTSLPEESVTCVHCGAIGEARHWFCPQDGNLMLGGRAIGDEWVLGSRLGRGGTGAVYLAHHRVDGRAAAVKLLGPRMVEEDAAEAVQRSLRESAGRVRHPNCVEIHDVGRIQGIRGQGSALWWIRMEHVHGRSLEEVSSEGPLTVDLLFSVSEQICAGLHACHEAGVVHRELKPSNVLIEIPTGRVKVADFGIARLVDQPRMTVSNEVLGAPLHVSPEQFQGETVDERSDLFALGVVLYELVTGRHPFVDRPDIPILEVMRRVVSEEPFPFVRGIDAYPAPLEDIVLRLLQKRPCDRFVSAAAVRDALLDRMPVEVRITNRDLGVDVTFWCARGDALGSVRARALAQAHLLPVVRRLLEKAGTRFGWEVKNQRLTDEEPVARACAFVGEVRPVELRLRVHPPDVLLGG